MLAEDLAAYDEADQIRVNMVQEGNEEEDRWVLSTPAKPIILELMCNGKLVHALIDSGAGTNLLSDRMTRELRIAQRPLVAPVEVRLAIATEGTPLVLREFAIANLQSHPPSI
jgi:hypothetical protein